MKLFKIIVLILFSNQILMAQKNNIITDNSQVEFVIKNIGINVKGTFSGLNGQIFFDANDLKNSFIDVSIDANSVNTDNQARDKHLRKPDYFDAVQYPKISFKSTKIEKASRLNRYNIEGNLTIKGSTKSIKLETIISEKDDISTLKTNFEINRRNFKVGDNSLVLSDKVKLNLNVLFGR